MANSLTNNPMLPMTIWSSLSSASTPRDGVAHVAVHAWFEGHIAAHLVAGEKPLALAAGVPEEAFPSPPFPSNTDPELLRIIREANERFRPAVAQAAVAYGAALAWEAGFGAGEQCSGCSQWGIDASRAMRIRTGREAIVIGGE